MPVAALALRYGIGPHQSYSSSSSYGGSSFDELSVFNLLVVFQVNLALNIVIITCPELQDPEPFEPLWQVIFEGLNGFSRLIRLRVFCWRVLWYMLLVSYFEQERLVISIKLPLQNVGSVRPMAFYYFFHFIFIISNDKPKFLV